MPMVSTKDGTSIYYKASGDVKPVLFSHGWPLSADDRDDQMVFLASQGFRCIAYDRRGHGRSGQPWTGDDIDTYAGDRPGGANGGAGRDRSGARGPFDGWG